MRTNTRHIAVYAFILFSLTTVLSSCGSEDTTDTTASSGSTDTKTTFIAEVIEIGDASSVSEVEKSARIVASSSLVLTSQSAGEVSKVHVKEGQSVKAGSVLVSLKDTLTNLDLRLEQAENALELQVASFETSEVNLNSAVENAKIALERAKLALENTTSKNSIEYDSIVNNNNKTFDTYNISFNTYLSDIDRTATQLLFEGDKILGISPDFDTATDSWDPYLGVRIGDSRTLAVNAWNKAYAARGAVRAKIEKGGKFDPAKALEDIKLATESYETIRKYVDAMIYMIQNNVVGGGLSQVQQDGWVAAWNGYRSQIQGSEAQFTGWKAQIQNFLETYQDTETATKLAVKSLTSPLTAEENTLIMANSDTRIAYENTRITLIDKLNNAKLGLEQAESGYRNALSLRDATLKQLRAGRRSSEISLEQAKRDYAKLRIVAPVDGTITSMKASLGQTVGQGTALVDISGREPEIIVDIPVSLASTLTTGESVEIKSDDGASFTGKITAVSQVSGGNLLSTLRIGVPGKTDFIGKTVKVVIRPETATTGTITLPLDALKIISEGEAEITIVGSDGNIQKKVVKIGSILGEKIEILDAIEKGTKIVVTDMTNYDPTKNTLQIKTNE